MLDFLQLFGNFCKLQAHLGRGLNRSHFRDLIGVALDLLTVFLPDFGEFFDRLVHETDVILVSFFLFLIDTGSTGLRFCELFDGFCEVILCLRHGILQGSERFLNAQDRAVHEIGVAGLCLCELLDGL